MPSFLRTRIFAVLLSSLPLACDSDASEPELDELRADATGATNTITLRELDDPADFIYVEGLTLQVLVDPASAPKDINTGVIEGEAMVMVDGPYGQPLKLKLKIVVLPAGPTAE
jgi:hypothetical protein